MKCTPKAGYATLGGAVSIRKMRKSKFFFKTQKKKKITKKKNIFYFFSPPHNKFTPPPILFYLFFGVHFSIRQMLNSHLFYNRLKIFRLFCPSDTFVSLLSESLSYKKCIL